MATGERSEIESYLGYVCRSIDRMVACLDELTEEEANTPPTRAASSLRTLAVHAMGNVEENVIGVFARGAVARIRDAEFTNDARPSKIGGGGSCARASCGAYTKSRPANWRRIGCIHGAVQ